MQLSWDLHVHPGPSAVPRWGTGAQVWAAAARAGLRGFVWKSHEMHTAIASAELPAGPPLALGSASLNAWASPSDVEAAVAAGARWIWGTSRGAGLALGWELPLPAWWPELVARLARRDEPLVLATGHLDAPGRRAFAELAASAPRFLCSVTHAAFLPPAEITALHDLGCAFEVDLYTAAHDVPGRPRSDLPRAIGQLRGLGARVYLTTDAGQPETGDPYRFAAAQLAALEQALGTPTVEAIAVGGPEQVVQHVLGSVLTVGGHAA